jgi:hypothetical protein
MEGRLPVQEYPTVISHASNAKVLQQTSTKLLQVRDGHVKVDWVDMIAWIIPDGERFKRIKEISK